MPHTKTKTFNQVLKKASKSPTFRKEYKKEVTRLKNKRVAKKKENKESYKVQSYISVEIPHLKFTVHFMDMSKLRGVPVLGAGYTCAMEDNSICVFIQDIAESVYVADRIPFIAHEIVHVIQILCDKYKMKIENEIEHMAYIMKYLLDEVMNVKVNPNQKI